MKKDKSNRPGYGKILDAWVRPADAGEPVGCMATSFTFSPAMFEEECLGRFVALESNAVEDGPAYLVEREEKLSQLCCAAALVDQHYARGVRSLRWDLLSARVAPGILHAKIGLLLWSNHARLIVGSANLTDDGYRRNQEVFGVLDYFDGSQSPLGVLEEICDFLREAVNYAKPAEGLSGTAIDRCLGLIERVFNTTRKWGAAEPPRGFARPRVIAVLTGPGRPNAFSALRRQWPDGSPPGRAYVVSPFFDPPGASNEPARQIWNLLKQRGSASVEYDVTAEEVPGEQALLLHAPESIVKAQPAQRSQVKTIVRHLQLEDSRPLHAKCLWLENERHILSLIGSSNFTSAGLGLGTVQNLEANLGFVLNQQSSDAKKALSQAWLPSEPIDDDLELRWKPREDDGEDSPSAALLVLPRAFAEASFGSDGTDDHYLSFSFVGQPPKTWVLFPEDADKPFVTEAEWQTQGRPGVLRMAWKNERPPSGFRVSWSTSDGFAWWPVNVVDSAVLPPPEELKNLPLEVLINILTSAKPLHLALARWLKNRSGVSADSEATLDPHKRVDTSAFLLQRTRRVSWALAALRQRLEKPVFSEESLAWRLRGPIGAMALAQAIGKEARSEAERCFLLTELCLDLARVRPQIVSGSLTKKRMQTALKDLIGEIRNGIPAEALNAHPAMAEYARAAFEEVVA